MSLAPSAVILVIDQLSAAMLGPYGNTMIETSNFNRLAAQSLLFDFAFVNSMDLVEGYDALWTTKPVLDWQFDNLIDCHALDSGRNAAEPIEHEELATAGGGSPSLIERFAAGGVATVLITDDPIVAEHAKANFDRVIVVPQVVASRSARRSSATQLATFFAQATAWIAGALEPGQICWLHSRGLSGAWDAPYDWRQQFAGEDDPDPPTFVEPPAEWIDPSVLDPDRLLGWQQAAAAQVLLIDECLGVLLDELDSSPIASALLFGITSTRGCGLGEHGLVGVGLQLYEESVHVPLLVRLPDLAGHRGRRVGRSGALMQIDELSELLTTWLLRDPTALQEMLDPIDQVLPGRNNECVVISSNEQESLQTHAWKLIRSKMGGVQLYAKPDDRCEVNNIGDRCPEVVEKMLLALDRRLTGEQVLLSNELMSRVD